MRLSRSHIVVALQNSVHIYKFSSPPEKVSVFETADNFFGLCCVGPTAIVFPGRTPGQVQLFEIGTGNISIIPAHVAPLRALELSPDGEILATASETVFGRFPCAFQDLSDHQRRERSSKYSLQQTALGLLSSVEESTKLSSSHSKSPLTTLM